MKLITHPVKILQNGCKKKMFMKQYNITGYEKSDEHVYCGEEFPKGYTDKRHNEKLYPRFLCGACK